MIAAEETFRDAASRECRGITFRDERIVGRPLHKFFNLGERQETQPDRIDWSRATRCMEKRDGSLIHTVHLGDGFVFKSKKSFTSEQARAAQAWAPAALIAWCVDLVEKDRTAIFEWVAPEHRIVIGYPEPGLTLLHIRENQSGRYFTRAELEASNCPVPIVEEDHEAWEALKAGKLIELAQTKQGVEGWVVQFDDGEMVKVKTQWYLDRHHLMTELRRRDVARAVLIETLDDVKTMLIASGIDIEPILVVERDVLQRIRTIEVEVERLYASSAGMSRKDIAIANKEHPYFGLLMQRVSGKEPDFKGHFERNVLDQVYDLGLVVEK